MTLKKWVQLSGIKHTTPTTEREAVSVLSDDRNNPLHANLWHLSDYVVTAVAGSVVWMVPRRMKVCGICEGTKRNFVNKPCVCAGGVGL